MKIEYKVIASTDALEFNKMAVKHFTEINPNFTPKKKWKQHYFRSIVSNSNIHAYWIVASGKLLGFFIYLLEKHPFYRHFDGVIREVYVEPEYRRMGIATKIISFISSNLERLGVQRIFVDMVQGDKRAESLWKKNGFSSFTQRHMLSKK